MSRNTAELILGANAQRLRQGLAGARREVQTFTTRTRTMMAGLGAGLKRNLLSIPGQLGLIGGTAGLFMVGRNIVNFDNALNRLGIQGNITKKKLFELREEMFNTALEAGVSRSAITEGIAAVVERTGNADFAIKTHRDLAIASQATGAAMGDLGALASQLDAKLNIKPSGLMEALDILTGQGKAGAFTLENMAAMAERLLASAGRLDMTGIEDLSQIGAFAQIARSGTGSPEQATTAVERTLANILLKQKEISGFKFDIYDKKTGQVKKLDEILKGIIIKTKGSEAVLGKLFGEEGIRAVSVLAKAYRETGKFEQYDKYLSANYAGTIEADIKKRMETLTFQFNKLIVLGEKLGESLLGTSLEKINNHLQKILDNPEKLKELDIRFKSIGKSVGSLVSGIASLAKHWKLLLGGFALLKGFNFARSFGLFGGLRGGKGGALPGAGVPVTVTNWPLGFGGAGGGAAAASAGILAKLALILGTVGPIAIALVAAAAWLKKEHGLMKQEREDIDFYTKAGFDRRMTTAGNEGDVAPAATLRNEIRLNVEVHVDKDGEKTFTGASVLDKPAKGVSQQTFLESFLTGGDR